MHDDGGDGEIILLLIIMHYDDGDGDFDDNSGDECFDAAAGYNYSGGIIMKKTPCVKIESFAHCHDFLQRLFLTLMKS